MNGLDGFVFTAGIGEHSPVIRRAICDRLQWLGVEIDEDANSNNAPVISTEATAVEVRIVPTNEEAMIAHHTVKSERIADFQRLEMFSHPEKTDHQLGHDTSNGDQSKRMDQDREPNYHGATSK